MPFIHHGNYYYFTSPLDEDGSKFKLPEDPAAVAAATEEEKKPEEKTEVVKDEHLPNA